MVSPFIVYKTKTKASAISVADAFFEDWRINVKPVIGLIPLFDDEKQSYWMLPGYMKAIEHSGGVPIMLPLSTDKEELDVSYKLCDGILFTGGHDVSPKIYGQKASEKCGAPCKERDQMEAYILDKCLEDDKPILGICRGIQFINAHLGGTLYQDLPSEFVSSVNHHMTPPYDRTVHKITVLDGTKLADIIGPLEFNVNSYHHQAIKELSPMVDKMAISEDGLVEAIAVKNHRFAIGVQWHPEFSYTKSEENVKIINAFVNECK